MKIVIDDQIPELANLLTAYAEITSLPSIEITHPHIQNADALFVRTVTKITRDLIHDTRIKFIASASAGIDHVDLAYLQRQQIHYCYAPGCNALAVMNYLMSTIATLGFDIVDKKIGVIGIGRIGKLVSETLKKLGAQVFQKFRPDDLFSAIPNDCDLITLHPSLTFNHHPSYHLIEAKFLAALKPGAILINASRGAVINEAALTRDDLLYCLDVFEHEPQINVDLFHRAAIATPHIAGYSLAAKYRASLMLFDAFCDWQNLPKMTIERAELENKVAQNQMHLKLDTNWQEKILEIYDPRNDKFDPAKFTQARKNYVLRKEIVFF